MVNKTVGSVVKEYFPGASEDLIEFIVWEKTGFPSFWLTKDEEDAEGCFRRQLQEFSDELNARAYYQEVGVE